MNRTHTALAGSLFLLTAGCIGPGEALDEGGDTGEDEAAVSGAAVTVTRQFFGQHWSSKDAWPVVSFGSGKFAPGLGWRNIETSRGHYDFSSIQGWLDVNAQTGHHQAMSFLYAAIYTPQWALTLKDQDGLNHPPSDLRTKTYCQKPLAGRYLTDCSFKEYLTAVIENFCTGTAPNMTCPFTSWEMHNEGNVKDEYWAGTYADLALMDADAVETIKGLCASCVVLGTSVSAGGDGWHGVGPTSAQWDTFLTQYLQAWPPGRQMPDALSWHPYPFGDMSMVDIPFPETYAGSQCPMPAPNRYCRGTVVQQIQRIRSIADSIPGMKGKPLWATEGGFTLSQLTNANATVQSQLRAAYVARYLLALASGGVQREFWYTYDEGNWGTELVNGAVTSVGAATQQVYNWLVGNTLSGPCSNGGSGTWWICSLTGPGGLAGHIVWNTAGNNTYTVPSTYHYWRDLTGPTKHAQSGPTHLVGIEPILFLNQ
jgi:hypothetical protein